MKSNSPEETFTIGEELAAQIRAGDLILLYGGLGAGKTLLTKGILSGIGFDVDEVTSPSFSLVNLYKTDRFDVYHIDLWRIEGGNAADAVDLDEILDNGDAVTIIEWADRLDPRSLRDRTTIIELQDEGGESREISIQRPGDD